MKHFNTLSAPQQVSAEAVALIGAVENIFAEWKTVRDSLNRFTLVLLRERYRFPGFRWVVLMAFPSRPGRCRACRQACA